MRFLIAIASFVSLPLSASAALLSTMWTNADEHGGGFMFDLTSTFQAGTQVRDWYLNMPYNIPSWQNYAVKIWHRDGSYVGNELTPQGWHVHGEVIIPAGTPTPVWFAMDELNLPFNQTTGIYLHFTIGAGMRGVNMPPANSTYEIPGLRLDGGVMRSQVGTGDPFAAAVFDQVMWSGAIRFSPIPEPATMAGLGVGIATLLARRRNNRA